MFVHAHAHTHTHTTSIFLPRGEKERWELAFVDLLSMPYAKIRLGNGYEVRKRWMYGVHLYYLSAIYGYLSEQVWGLVMVFGIL